MINGLKYYCGSHKVGFQRKNHNQYITVPFSRSLLFIWNSVPFFTLDDQLSLGFPPFLKVYEGSGFQIWPHGCFRPSEEIERFRFFKRALQKSRNVDPMVWIFFFENISKYMRNQWPIFENIAVLDLIHMLNGLDLDYGTHKVGIQSKKGNP